MFKFERVAVHAEHPGHEVYRRVVRASGAILVHFGVVVVCVLPQRQRPRSLASYPRVCRGVFAHLDALCRAAGRDPATLRRTAFGIVSLADTASLPGRFPDPRRTGPFSGTLDEIAVQLRALRTTGVDHGVDHMVCIVDNGETPGPLLHYPVVRMAGFERFLEVAKAMRRLEAS